ncbi:hypothetical protein EZ449_16525 [Pedobacter frigidisoli]|uniref:Uncharacterized protein n=1 Tax=Pedobacter frigidisoli TaxID=2530455 RepID=A0A4R0NTD7_9SPHI|nr:hypothetical protein [Pedobacter frigidisoli]TCD04558.1 hypothetical protein EZ449_16525 [Pedobacter frigidisoli]
MTIKRSLPVPLIFLMCLLMHFLILFSNVPFAQAHIAHPQEQELVTTISRFLARSASLNKLSFEDSHYAFNLKINIIKRNNKSLVSNIEFSNSVGQQVFSTVQELKKFDYYSLVKETTKSTIIIPILILNNPSDSKNPRDIITGMTKNSLIDMISSLFYPNLLQKNITLFPVFIINRLDIH